MDLNVERVYARTLKKLSKNKRFKINSSIKYLRLLMLRMMTHLMVRAIPIILAMKPLMMIATTFRMRKMKVTPLAIRLPLLVMRMTQPQLLRMKIPYLGSRPFMFISLLQLWAYRPYFVA